MYAVVNEMLGDIVKVTPSSKMVGDLALFMLTNNLTPQGSARTGQGAHLPRVGDRLLRRARSASPTAASRSRWRTSCSRAASRSPGRPGDTMPPGRLRRHPQARSRQKIGRPASDQDVLSLPDVPEGVHRLRRLPEEVRRRLAGAHRRDVLRPAQGRRDRGGDRARQDPVHPAAGRQRAQRARRAHAVLRAQRPPARGRGAGQAPRQGGRRPPQGRQGQPAPPGLAHAGHGGRGEGRRPATRSRRATSWWCSRR